MSSVLGSVDEDCMEDVLIYGHYYEQFEASLIEEQFDFLIPEKMNIYIFSKKYQYKTDSVEKWYATDQLK